MIKDLVVKIMDGNKYNTENVKIIYTTVKNIKLTNKLGCVQIKKSCKIINI